MVSDPIRDEQNYVDFVLNYVDLRVAPIELIQTILDYKLVTVYLKRPLIKIALIMSPSYRKRIYSLLSNIYNVILI